MRHDSDPYHIILLSDDGEKVTLKTSNLLPLEIAQEVQVLDEIHTRKVEEANAAKRKR